MVCCTGCGCGGHHRHGNADGQEETTELKVSGMGCQHCVMSIKKSISSLAGVNNVEVDLKSGQVTVTHAPGQPSGQAIQEAIRDAGYEPEV